ncbi:MAG: sulfurtransferase-like selenium metabolism protein YedF [Syntrophomonadaceae bacterium]|jgi:selenium metabolism protein YedF|nr:sulfurtransferase-like selenium metabolism protein YedF [Syntrophomonadaceae bacterium]
MKKIVDTRGLTCPQPVILTRQALIDKEVDEVITIVDNQTALENISKLASSMNLESSVDEKGGQFYISILKDDALENNLLIAQSANANMAVLITSNVLGKGDDTLGNILMKSFMYTLTQMEGAFRTIIFMNSGVLLTTEGSEVLEYIRALEDRQIEVLSCGTCLDYYHLSDKLRVGSVTNMFTITEKIMEAQRLITL